MNVWIMSGITFVITASTALITLFSQDGVQSFSDISEVSYASAVLGAIVAAMTHIKTRMGGNQKGFARISLLIALAMGSLLVSCATIKQSTQQFADCLDVRTVNNQTIAACYVAIETLADQADALADSGVITKQQEMEFLAQLADTIDVLAEVRRLSNVDATNATERLQLAQSALAAIARTLEDKQ